MLRRWVLFFFLLFVFSSTFSIAISQLSLGFCTIGFFVLLAVERHQPLCVKLKGVWIGIAAYVGWLVLVCLIGDDPVRSLDHIREEWLWLVLPIGWYLMKDHGTREKILMALSAGLLLVSIASLVMSLFGVQYHWPTGFEPVAEGMFRLRGNFTHPLTFGNYTAVASIFLLGYSLSDSGDTGRWTVRLALSAGSVGLLVTLLGGSRGPILALALGLIALVIFVSARRRLFGLILLAVVVLGTALTPGVRDRFMSELGYHFNTDWPGGRLFIWHNSVSIVEDHPWVGVGPGNFGEAYKARLDPGIPAARRYGHAHNDFIQAAARSGLPGLITFGFMWFVTLRYLWARFRRSGTGSTERATLVAALLGSLVFLASSMTEAVFADEEVRALLMLVWATGLSVAYNGSDRPDLTGKSVT